MVTAMVAAGNTSAVTAALEYASFGWPVLPVVARGKLPLTTHGLKDASTDPGIIAEWWKRWPDANVGIATGPPGPTVIDCDGPIGRHNFSKLVGVGWASSPWSETGGGGWHICYAGDPDVRNRAGFMPKVDVRGIGGYVVAAPSVHSSGAVYQWCATPSDRELVPLPEVVRDALNVRAHPIDRVQNVRLGASRATTGSNYATAALDAEVANVRAAPVGTRNDMLVRASFSLGTLVGAGRLDANLVISELVDAATVAGLPPSEAAATIRSGFRAGLERPRCR